MSNVVTSGPVLASSSRDAVLSYADGRVDFTFSLDLSARYEPLEATLWTRSAPRGLPCFSLELLGAMERASLIVEGYFSHEVSRQPLAYVALRSGIQGAFNIGGDLGYFIRLIAAQDRARLTEYARIAVNVAYRNHTAHGLRGVTTVALLEGDALGGGFESALSCDVVIAEEHVKAGFPEVLFNMFPGMGGLSFLSRRVTRRVADELTRSGRLFAARELLEMGVIDEVVPTGAAVGALKRMIRVREHQRQSHAVMNAVDRLLRPVSLSELTEVVRMWVDCALTLDARSVEWMRRLLRQQMTTFSGRLTVVPTGPAAVVT